MHPKELTPRSKLLKQLDDSMVTPREQFRNILDKYSKVNDGMSFKAKFYNILEDNVHREGSFKVKRGGKSQMRSGKGVDDIFTHADVSL